MSEILSGWKEISDHLGVSEPTAHRYKKFRGLPVKNDPAGHPVITKEDVKRWKMSCNDIN